MTSKSTAFDHITFRGYTHVMCAFATQDPSVERLRSGLESVIQRAPYLAGTVSFDDSRTACEWHHISEPYSKLEEIFTVEHKEDVLDYTIWKNDGCPVRDVIAFCAADPAQVPPPAPVMRVRLTIVRGGCFLSTSIHHCAIDGAGMARVVEAWAAACRGDSDTVLSRDNGPNVDSSLHQGDIERHPAYMLLPVEGIPAQPPEATAAFFFSTQSLAKLKLLASQDLPSGSWISTHDALTALLWTRISIAKGLDSGVNVATNIRHKFQPPVDASYVGNAVYFCRANTQPKSLSEAALAVRNAVSSVTLSQLLDMAAIVTSGHRVVEAHAALDGPVAVTSWAAQGYHSFDWGNEAFAGLKCDRVLAPKWFRPRLCVILPQRPGGLDVVVGLRREHMDRLLEDNVFREFATWESGYPRQVEAS